MKSSVTGKVISATETKWRVKWTIREATIVLDHREVVWKPNGDVGSVSGPAEEDQGGHEMEAAGEDDNEGHEEGEDDVNEPSPKVQDGR